MASSGILGLAPTYNGLWTSGTCGTGKAAPSQSNIGGNPITELAGFSLGRLGPIYFLDAHPSWESQINYILLLDPGSASDMFAPSCDSNPAIKPWVALSQWLTASPSHHLVVIAGPATLSDGFAGLDLYYLSQITATERPQVMICSTSSPSHPNFLDDGDHGFGWMVGAPRPTSCPGGTKTVLPTPSPTSAPSQPTQPTSPPATSPSVALAEGAVAPAGYWYAITLSDFTPSSTVSVTCADASDPQGFRTFSLTTDSAGAASTSSECYSGVGGDHWVAAAGVESNHVAWQAPAPPAPTAVDAYNNYGSANAGHAMCRGNPGVPQSMPGGTATQTFTVPSGVASIDAAKVQIDPDATVTAHLTVFVNGNAEASDNEVASGDTNFSFSSVSVAPGDQVMLQISFTATYGKIITVYTAGAPGGTFSTSNSCPDGAPSITETNTGLRAVVSGWS